MEKIKIGITSGDINSVSLEVILKSLSQESIFQYITPVIYGNIKIASYHKNIVNLENLSLNVINPGEKPKSGRINVVNSWTDNVTINLGKPSVEGGKFAFKLSDLLQPWVLKIGNMSPFTVNLVCSILMFTLVCVGIFFLAKLFTGLVNIAALGIFNKILGAIFGMLKYAFITSVILYFFNQLDVKHHYLSADKKAESHLYYPILKMAPMLLPVMKEMKDGVTSATEKWEEIKLKDIK